MQTWTLNGRIAALIFKKNPPPVKPGEDVSIVTLNAEL